MLNALLSLVAESVRFGWATSAGGMPGLLIETTYVIMINIALLLLLRMINRNNLCENDQYCTTITNYELTILCFV